MLWLFRFISGFLTVRLSGDYAERIINIAAANGITLWNLRYRKQTITGCVSIRGFKRLRKIHKGTKVKIKILKKQGLPFLSNKYRNRAAFFAGAVIFFLLLEFLSSFVWGIQVSGNSTVSQNRIIEGCKKIGVYEGVLKNKIDARQQAQELLLITPELAWAALNVEGCILTVDVTEVKNPVTYEDTLPSNLISTADGVVKKIDVTSGNVLVSVGDSVAKGEVLVSGIIEKLTSTVFLKSSGSITAEISMTVTEEGTYKNIFYKPDGKSKKRTVIEAFGIKIPLYIGKVKGNYKAKLKCNQFEFLGKKLPIKTYTKTFDFTEKNVETYTEEELKEILRNKIKARLNKSGCENYTVKSEKTEITDKGIVLIQEIITTVNIAEEKKISVIKE